VHIVYIASFIQEKLGNAVDIKFLDLVMERIMHQPMNYNDPDVIKRVLKEKIDKDIPAKQSEPLIIAISCYTSYQYLSTVKILKAIRDLAEEKAIQKPFVVLGGYHPTVVPHDFDNLGVDYVVKGEGEISLLEIVSACIARGTVEGHDQMHVIAGKILKNLDEIPLTRYEIYQPYLELYPRLSLALSRGCPRACVFCLEQYLAGMKEPEDRWRSFSIPRAKQEIENVVKTSDLWLRNVEEKLVGIYDPIFGYNLSWREQVVRFMAEKRFPYKFWCETRIDTIKQDHLPIFKDANLQIMLGLETASPRMLTLMNKTRQPQQYLDRLRKIMAQSSQIGYGPIVLNLVCNFPGEDLASIDETFDFLTSLTRAGIVFTTTGHFYHMHPGDNLYLEPDRWEREYGTKVYFKHWWGDEATLSNGCIIDASRSLDFKTASIAYREKICNFYKDSMDKTTDVRYKFAFLKKIKAEGERIERNLHVYESLVGNKITATAT